MTPPVEQGLTEHGVTVLMVDDQPIVGEGVRRLLAEQKDIRFHYVKDPTQAIKAALEIRPTVILLDKLMPEIDGLTLLRFLRAKPELKDVPIVILSAVEEAETKVEAFELGASDYMVKPQPKDEVELVARIRTHSKGYISLLQRNEAFEELRKSRDKLQADLESAERYVRSLLPKEIAERGVETASVYIPSAHLGGDSYGYQWLDPNTLAMYLLDVCDHGVRSALLSVSVMNVINGKTLAGADFKKPETVLAALNQSFQMDEQGGLYFTMWYGVYDAAAGRLTFASGGHPPALLVSEGKVRELRTPGMVVGGMPGMIYTSASVDIPAGSRFYLYSDGVYEIAKTDGQMWEFEDFSAFMAGQTGPLGQAVENLVVHARRLQGGEEFADDFAMIEMRLGA